MYGIKLEKYVPKPQKATSDRIVAAHYYAAWKKDAAGLHDGFNDLHGYPERTPLMGYYDEADPEVCDWEIKWATEHGINCFIYCWYRKIENMGKPVTVGDLRCGHGLHEALFNARYANDIKFAIMFENSPRWGTTDKNDIVEHLMPFWTQNYFKRENYLVIDNKPVLFVYYQNRLDEVFSDPAEQKQAFDACREYAKSQGFDGMIFALCNTDKSKHGDSVARGYDFRFGYSSGYVPQSDTPTENEIIEGQCEKYKGQLEVDPMRFVPTATCFRDSTPRSTQKWIDMGYRFHLEKKWHLDADGFRKVIHRMKEFSDALPDGAWGKRIFMIDNWNEWDEGHYISPSHEYGFRYLQAVREELTARDNLPDYRMPHDIGLGGYEGEWTLPDFSDAESTKK